MESYCLATARHSFNLFNGTVCPRYMQSSTTLYEKPPILTGVATRWTFDLIFVLSLFTLRATAFNFNYQHCLLNEKCPFIDIMMVHHGLCYNNNYYVKQNKMSHFKINRIRQSSASTRLDLKNVVAAILFENYRCLPQLCYAKRLEQNHDISGQLDEAAYYLLMK